VIRVGVNYEGRDPRFVETVLPFADVVEVTPDAVATFRDGAPLISREILEELRAVSRDKTVTLHGVGLSIASAGAMNDSYFALTDTLMDALDVAWHSEHLGYTTVDGADLGTMLVPPRTQEVLELICGRVEVIQRRYAKPFLLEHVVNLFPDAGGEFTAAGFLNEIVRRTGCGVLLDLYNLECDAHNGIGGLDAFLDEIDLDAVREIHVACGTVDRGLRVDVHSRITRDETLALLRRVLPRTPNVEAVIFEILGPAVPVTGHDAIAAELQRVRAVVESVGLPAVRTRFSPVPAPERTQLSLREHQRAMADLIAGRAVADDPYISAAAQSTGLQVTRDSIRGWRSFRLDRNCRLTAALLKQRGFYDDVIEAIEREPVSPFIEPLSAAFLAVAATRGDALIASVAKFEQALLREDDTEESVDWPCNPYDVLSALLSGDAVPALLETPHRTIVSRAIPGLFRVEEMERERAKSAGAESQPPLFTRAARNHRRNNSR
jgi:uncharacterized protein (UPF0276 family)